MQSIQKPEYVLQVVSATAVGPGCGNLFPPVSASSKPALGYHPPFHSCWGTPVAASGVLHTQVLCAVCSSS